MPGYDGTGPRGTGPVGRGLGPCGQGQTNTSRSFFGFRRGWRGRGRGFRWFNRFPVNEKEDLETEKRLLKEQLDVINKRMDEIQKED